MSGYASRMNLAVQAIADMIYLKDRKSWFDDMPALRAAAATPEFERLRAEVANLVARDKSPAVLAAEYVVLA